jgi:ribokinase
LATKGSLQTQPAIIVVGSINADLIAYSNDENRIGNYVFGDSFRFNLGGKGLNQAVNVAASRMRTVLVGRVGDDVFGQKITDDLNSVGVDTEFVSIDKSAHTGIGHVRVNSSGDYDTVVVNGANSMLGFDDVTNALESIESVSFGLMNFEISSEVISKAAMAIRNRGGETIINFSPVVPGVEYVLSNADYFVANSDETASLLGETSGEVANLAARIQAQGVKNVVVTLGEDGVFGLDVDGNQFYVKAEKTKVLNTIGAGDTFLATFAVALQAGAKFETALAFANYAASLTCTKQESFLTAIDIQSAAKRFNLSLYK